MAIALSNIYKIYGKDESKVCALNNISLNINQGDLIAIMGPSGSGKSTLLNIIGCLDTQSDGEYIFKGKNIQDYSKRELGIIRNKSFGFIVQYFALLNDYTVYENISIPLEYSGFCRKERNVKVKEILKDLGIIDKLKKYPNELSGGQQQRVAIARALVNNPDIILADEPTGALDKKTGMEVINILQEINKKKKTVVIVTHDEKVASCCNRIIEMEDGQVKNDYI